MQFLVQVTLERCDRRVSHATRAHALGRSSVASAGPKAAVRDIGSMTRCTSKVQAHAVRRSGRLMFMPAPAGPRQTSHG